MERARECLEELSGEGKAFDYGTFFNEPGHGFGGSDRWGPRPPVSNLYSEQGAKELISAFEALYEDFVSHLKDVRKNMHYPDEVLFNNSMLKYCAGAMGKNEWLFFETESCDLSTFNSCMKEPGEGKYWIVPVDVHT
jgi:hypothetical protein